MKSDDAGLLRQTRALVPFALGNLIRGRWSSLTIIACVTLVIIILGAFLAMARGFANTATSTGSDTIAVLLGPQSQSEGNSQLTREQIELLTNAPGLVRAPNGAAILSPELTMTVSGHRRADRVRVNATLRGLTPAGFALHDGFRLVAGRMPQSGRAELIVGRKLAASTAASDLGDTIVLAGRRWAIVGRYALASPLFETEYLGDLVAVQSAYGRENQYQTVRTRLAGDNALDRLRAFVASDSRLGLDVKTEHQLYATQAKGTSDLIMYLGWPMATILSIGALAGVFNTMFITLEGRRHSLRVVRLLGFSPHAVVASVVVETVLLALVGAVLGLMVVAAAAHGGQTTVMGSDFTSITYDLRIDRIAVLESIGLALVIGLVGGLVPGIRLITARRI